MYGYSSYYEGCMAQTHLKLCKYICMGILLTMKVVWPNSLETLQVHLYGYSSYYEGCGQTHLKLCKYICMGILLTMKVVVKLT